MTAPTPQRAATAEERERLLDALRSAVAEWPAANTVSIGFTAGEWRTLLDRIDAAEARAEEAEAEIGLIDEALRLPAEMSDGERLARILGQIEDAQEHEGDAENRADAATTDRDRLADEVARLRGALKPFAKLRFSFDGFSCDPATLVFQHREYGQWRCDDHAAFKALIDAAARALAATGGTTDGHA